MLMNLISLIENFVRVTTNRTAINRHRLTYVE